MIEPVASGFISSSGAEIFYRTFGDRDPTLLFLHGNGEDFRAFSRQLEEFSKDFQIVAIDSRGHGKSTMGKGSLTIEKMAQDAVCVMDGLHIPTASVVGFSDGGNIAIALGLFHLERVEKLVLAGANLNPEGVDESFQKVTKREYLLCRLQGLFSKKYRKKCKILGLMVNQPHYVAQQLRQIFCPTLVLAGDRDMIKPEHTQLIAQSLPKGQCKIIPNSDHFVFKRQPQLVNSLIIGFLKS